jgi:hypothetical protein
MKGKDIGSNELNTQRDAHNDRVDKKIYVGNSKTAKWRRQRRNRPI